MGKKKRGGARTAPVSRAPSRPPSPPPLRRQSHSDSPQDEVVDPTVLASMLAVEYPLIDPSLIHALLLDYDPGTLGRHVESIRDQLGILEATSVPDEQAPVPSSPQLSSAVYERSEQFETYETLETLETYETDVSGPVSSLSMGLRTGTTITSTSTSPPSSFSDEDSPQTEHELLVSFFPGLSKEAIDDALASEPSLDAAIDHLLSVELIQGVERTGMWPGEQPEEKEEEMTPVTRGRRKKTKPKAKLTVPLVDTMQRRTPVASRSGSPSGSGSRTPAIPVLPSSDVWSAFASLAEHLSELLPRAQAGFFTTFLHSPDYQCAHEAVLASLEAVAASARIDSLPDEAASIVEDIYGYGLYDDAGHPLEICLRAAEGDVGVAMDLMDVLSDLTWWPDYEAAKQNARDPFDQLYELERALPQRAPSLPSTSTATSTATVPTTTPVTSTRVTNPNRLTRPKSEDPKKRATAPRVVPGSKPINGGLTSATGADFIPRNHWITPSSSKAQVPWQTVATNVRREGRRDAHPLAASIPAYARGMLPHDQRPGALNAAQRLAVGSNGPGPSIEQCYAHSNAAWRRREAAIRSASAHFKTGRRDLKGSVAAHYAARAREAGDAAREWELRGARIVVDSQMARNGHTVDLHYATVEQAVTLALETAGRWWAAVEAAKLAGEGSKPLTIVTGRGRHSAGQRGVLGPAVARALAEAGWRVDRAEGYVVVKGR